MNSNWSYSPETAKLGYDLCGLDLWPMTLTFCMDITSVVITPENVVMIRRKEHSEKGVTDRQTDRWTDRQTDRKRWSQSCLVAAKMKQQYLWDIITCFALDACFWQTLLIYALIPAQLCQLKLLTEVYTYIVIYIAQVFNQSTYK